MLEVVREIDGFKLTPQRHSILRLRDDILCINDLPMCVRANLLYAFVYIALSVY